MRQFLCSAQCSHRQIQHLCSDRNQRIPKTERTKAAASTGDKFLEKLLQSLEDHNDFDSILVQCQGDVGLAFGFNISGLNL